MGLCLEKNIGSEEQVAQSPLSNDEAISAYQPPPLDIDDWGKPVDWEARALSCAEMKAKGQLVQMFGGRLFDRMFFLRGFTKG